VPRQANDAVKPSGNLLAVYATTAVPVALLHAVLDRRRLSAIFDSYVVGHHVIDGKLTLKVTDNVYDLVTDDPSALWADGFVYVLDLRLFVQPADGGPEFVSPTGVTPALTLPVPWTVGPELLGVGRSHARGAVVRYSPAETARLAAHAARLEPASAAVRARSRPGGARPGPPP
jgi:hypothetical protein